MHKIREEIKYVCGFLFDEDTWEKVALIRKNKPEWQAGKLNGIGGKIEDGETPIEAMMREFREETGRDGFDWKPLATIKGDGYSVVFFRAWGPVNKLLSVTEEKIEIHKVRDLWELPVISNLRWLIPMALDINVLATEKYEVLRAT